jgi:rhodanese-related sulfurtransferase
MKKLFSLGAFVFLLTSCGAQTPGTAESKSDSTEQGSQICERIDADKFRQGIAKGNVQILDVRTPQEVSEGKIDGSLNINFNDSDFSNQVNSKLDKKVPVYLYCRSGGRSQKAMTILKDLGFSVVYELNGGFMNY